MSVWWLWGLAGCGVPDTLPDWEDSVPIEGDIPSCAPPRDVRVACVVDGDTLDVGQCGEDDGERIRLLGVNAPELAHDDAPAECWADLATAQLERLVLGIDITLTFDAECEDIYGRTLAYLWIPAPEDEEEDLLVNEELLLEGHVRLYDEEWVDDLRHQTRLEDAEAEARAKGLGLWAACDDEDS